MHIAAEAGDGVSMQYLELEGDENAGMLGRTLAVLSKIYDFFREISGSHNKNTG